MSQTTTSTALRIGTAADGQRTVAVSTSTTVRTGPEFREQLDRACRPSSTGPRQDATAPVASAPTTATPRATQAPRCTSELCDQLREMIRQLLEALEQQGHRGAQGRHGIDWASRSSRPHAPTGTTSTPSLASPACPPSSAVPAVPAAQPTQPAPAAPPTHCAAQRIFDVKPAGEPDAVPTRQLVVRGGIAGAPVTTGEKLDEGVRRIASFLDQIGHHLQAGGTFTDEQLQSIADEATGIYYEAIRPTLGEGDVGDYTSPARDGVLDLGASTRSILVQATVHAADPIAAKPAAAEASPIAA